MADTDFPMHPEKIAQHIDFPLEDWPGNCHGVAEAILKRLPVEGMRLVRGHYTGHVSKSSVYRGSIQQHSWLELEDGRIMDPTRWAMDRPGKPYLYIGENDAYDEGGLALRAKQRPSFSIAAMLSGNADQKENSVLKKLQILDPGLVREMFEAGGMGAPAELSLSAAERLTSRFNDPVEHFHRPEDFFSAVKEAGLSALVPFDTMTRVLSPEKVTVDRGANMLWKVVEPDERSDAQKLCMVLCRYLSIEEREITIEKELEEIGYTLDDLHEYLNRMESEIKWSPDFESLSRSVASGLAVISSELLGKGFGVEIDIERYAKSVGLDRNELHRAMVSLGERAGYDLPWLIGDEADRAMSTEAWNLPDPM